MSITPLRPVLAVAPVTNPKDAYMPVLLAVFGAIATAWEPSISSRALPGEKLASYPIHPQPSIVTRIVRESVAPPTLGMWLGSPAEKLRPFRGSRVSR